ncbi:MAG: DNA repair protein RadC [Clostridia bacterium]|nr:DNA repair protein RadC [Clostridia bacterium]
MTVKKESENKKPHNPHEKHRSRMFDKVKNGHVGSLTDVELLEMSLFYVIPRSNTNVTAHNLMDKYTSLKNLFSADCASLSEIDGIGPSSACFFEIVGELLRRVSSDQDTTEKRMFSVEQIGNLFIKKFKGISKECVMLLALDNKNVVIDSKVIYEGSVSSSAVSVRQVAKYALDMNAAAIVMAHNHPSGDASPSDDDIVLTRTIRRALAELDIPLLEHILVANDRYMPLFSYITRAAEEIDYLTDFGKGAVSYGEKAY